MSLYRVVAAPQHGAGVNHCMAETFWSPSAAFKCHFTDRVSLRILSQILGHLGFAPRLNLRKFCRTKTMPSWRG